MPAATPYAIELEVLKLNGKATQDEICQRFDLTPPTVRRIFRTHGVKWIWQSRDQRGEKNTNFQGGVAKSTIERLTRQVVLNSGRCLYTCERCGDFNKEQEQARHHKDRDRSNNGPDNIEVLCQACHMKEHNAERSRNEYGQFVD